MCWQCKEFVKGTCPIHGDLVPCKEQVTGRGRKDPLKCPVPSSVEIKLTDIPGAGHGVFATDFILPGIIIGIITENYHNSISISIKFILLIVIRKEKNSVLSLGEYKGKLISEKKYRELEKTGKESGYAWKVCVMCIVSLCLVW